MGGVSSMSATSVYVLYFIIRLSALNFGIPKMQNPFVYTSFVFYKGSFLELNSQWPSQIKHHIQKAAPSKHHMPCSTCLDWLIDRSGQRRQKSIRVKTLWSVVWVDMQFLTPKRGHVDRLWSRPTWQYSKHVSVLVYAVCTPHGC